MKRTLLAAVFLLGTILLSACGNPTQRNPEPVVAATSTPAALPTEIPLPTESLATLPPLPETPEPTPSDLCPTSLPLRLMQAQIAFDNYNLRTGPGRLFDRIGTYEQGSIVNVIGREASDNWVYVQTGDFRAGWMKVEGLTFYGGLASMPVIVVDNVQVLQGHVYLAGRLPASAIGVSIASPDVDLSASTDVSTTNAEGLWSIYLPNDIRGSWIVGPNAYGCESNAVDANCNLAGSLPGAQTVTLPFPSSVMIEFEIQPQ